MQNDTRIAVDVAKSVLEIEVSDRPGESVVANACRELSGSASLRCSSWPRL
jgi:hypothetical protein